jgi:hypothetical protein
MYIQLLFMSHWILLLLLLLLLHFHYEFMIGAMRKVIVIVIEF